MSVLKHLTLCDARDVLFFAFNINGVHQIIGLKASQEHLKNPLSLISI